MPLFNQQQQGMAEWKKFVLVGSGSVILVLIIIAIRSKSSGSSSTSSTPTIEYVPTSNSETVISSTVNEYASTPAVPANPPHNPQSPIVPIGPSGGVKTPIIPTPTGNTGGSHTTSTGSVVQDVGTWPNWNGSLWGIAQHYYGNGNLWPRIFSANQNQISNPNLIYPGQKLVIPFP